MNIEAFRSMAKHLDLKNSSYLKIETESAVMEFKEEDVKAIATVLERSDNSDHAKCLDEIESDFRLVLSKSQLMHIEDIFKKHFA